ncbi:dodecin [Croceicoccus bisphenolivorans]|uniref:dodecin n=1 Tax=Croceicoccus bisphenolivorans TaxID=1783232 RepID=UPI00082B8FC5|nr:dodecin [Croceicoccus bisphenolivorans]
MSDHVFKLTEIVGTSHKGSDAAIEVALKRAQATIRKVKWYEVVSQRGYVEDDGTIQHQVVLKVGFVLED